MSEWKISPVGTELTLDELADEISYNLPAWQREGNLAFLRALHQQLKDDGGTWIFPARLQTWVKTEKGFRRTI